MTTTLRAETKSPGVRSAPALTESNREVVKRREDGGSTARFAAALAAAFPLPTGAQATETDHHNRYFNRLRVICLADITSLPGELAIVVNAYVMEVVPLRALIDIGNTPVVTMACAEQAGQLEPQTCYRISPVDQYLAPELSLSELSAGAEALSAEERRARLVVLNRYARAKTRLTRSEIQQYLSAYRQLLRREGFSFIDLAARMPSVESLDLSESDIGDQELGALIHAFHTHRIKHLDLAGCPNISAAGLRSLSAINNYLVSLNLRGNDSLQDISSLANLRELRELYLNCCSAIQDISALANLRGLRELYLTGCLAIQDISSLANLRELRVLYLGGCTRLSAEQTRWAQQLVAQNLARLGST